MLVFKHPKYYEEMRRRAKLGQERERASKQAREREGGPTGSERTKVTSGSRADKR